MKRLSTCLAAATAIAATAAATTTLTTANTSYATTALSNRWYAAAPYLMPLDNNPPDPGALMDSTGLKAFQLAFVLAPNGGGCTPTWDGTADVSSDTAVRSVIDTIRAKGGDVSVSIGGYGGTKLGQVCADPSATAAAYQQVITKYGLHAIDFDLEEPEYENTAAVHNEIGAAKILQQNNPGLYVSVTTAGTADGTGWFGKQMLLEAKAQGFTPTDPPTSTPTVPGTGCDAAWSGASVYTAGDEVSYDFHHWKAKWWTQNETPGAAEWGPWQDEGAC
ncbi:carbohydrate-binding protein [Streptomyces sp. NPDC091279]|uniref:carbohydrate-binding protein n=1 Tax=Streptomyces sp. NPDC091279 TaxID=3365983 RepID=UPI00382A7438